MNTLIVTKNCTVSAPGVADQALVVGDEIAPWSPFYWTLKWSNNAVDSGHEDASGALPQFRPAVVVVGPDDPHLPPGGVWIEDRGNGDWTMWFEE